MWTKTISWEQMPKVVDPPGGFVQNSNDSTWTSTIPQVLRREEFPLYISFEATPFRPQHGLEFRVLPDLLAAAGLSADATLAAAVKTLRAWDRSTDADSRGAVLFERWYESYLAALPNSAGWPEPDNPKTIPFRKHWSPADPAHTPEGLADPAAGVRHLLMAAKGLEAAFGRLDVSWGEIHRIRLVGRDAAYTHHHFLSDDPVSGSDDYFGGLRLADEDVSMRAPRRHLSGGGDGYVQLVEFTPTGAQVQMLLTYGNASRPGSALITDQLPAFNAKKLLPAWRSRAEILAHLERKENY